MKLNRLLFEIGLALVLPGQALHAQQSDADRQALAQLRAEAEKGGAHSQFQMGLAFYLGQFGLATNYMEAVNWIRKAAEQHYARALVNLGRCYENGQGVAKDAVEAYKWDLLAAAQGDTKAKRNATMLELMLSPEQIAEGNRRAQDWLERRKTDALQDTGSPAAQTHK